MEFPNLGGAAARGESRSRSTVSRPVRPLTRPVDIKNRGNRNSPARHVSCVHSSQPTFPDPAFTNQRPAQTFRHPAIPIKRALAAFDTGSTLCSMQCRHPTQPPRILREVRSVHGRAGHRGISFPHPLYSRRLDGCSFMYSMGKTALPRPDWDAACASVLNPYLYSVLP